MSGEAPDRRHARARELFLEIADLPASERDAALVARCADDAVLRAEVAALLAHVDGPVADVATAGAQATIGDAANDPPATVGPYRLVRKLGEGGMGAVYEAVQQEPVRRTVALKLIKLGMDTQQVVRRFEAERQAIALMSHPNIARVFDVGSTDTGSPYFAMEYVAGTPITDYCREHDLEIGARLELFMKVCSGVQHAHRNGVIHRDIKPSNVLVTGDGGAEPEPKIIDFGIAKATSERLIDETLRTEVGQLVGTPEYMSPEQADPAGPGVDTRSDVYSLGALLYEILTGVPPFDPEALRSAGLAELLETIRHADPMAPSERLAAIEEASSSPRSPSAASARALRGELDWIVLRALDKERDRRYPTPGDLAADIDRHLRDEPVLASPPSRRYRLEKFVRRHRVGVYAASVATLAVLLGAAVAAAGFFRALEAEREAVREARAARETSDFLLGMFRGFDPYAFRDATPTAREVLDRTAERIDQELGARPETRAALQTSVGGTYMALGLYDEARPLLEGAVETRRGYLGAEHPDVANSLSDLAWLEYNEGDYERCLAHLQEALRLRLATLGPDHIEVAINRSGIGGVYWRLGRYGEAMATLERAAQAEERILGPDHPLTIQTRAEQGLVQVGTGDWDAAQANLERAVQAREARDGPDHPGLALPLHRLADLLWQRNELEEAEALLVRGQALHDAALGDDHPDGARFLRSLGLLRLERGQYREAWGLLQRSLSVRLDALGAGHPGVAESIAAIAAFHARAGELELALDRTDEALRIAEAAEGAAHPAVGRLLVQRADVERRLGSLTAALESARRAVGILERAVGTDGPWVAEALRVQAEALADAGELESAGTSYERALVVGSRVMGSEHPFVAAVLHGQGALASRAGDPGVASRRLAEALRLREATLPAGHVAIGETLAVYGDVLRRTGQLDEAERIEARAQQIREEHRRAVASAR